MQKKQKKIVLTLIILLIFPIYIISYGLVLPMFENSYFCVKFIHALYIPVEYFRTKSLMLYNLTEFLYKNCGGKYKVEDRVFSKYLTYRYVNYKNGYLHEDIIANSSLYKAYKYNSKGNIVSYLLFDAKLNKDTFIFYYENGKKFKEIYKNKINEKLTKVYCKNGTIMADGKTMLNNNLKNGTFIFIIDEVYYKVKLKDSMQESKTKLTSEEQKDYQEGEKFIIDNI